MTRAYKLTLVLLLNFASSSLGAKHTLKTAGSAGQGILWRSPGDISSRNLFYGPGGKEHAPQGRFTFEKEDLGGTNPKFDVRDEQGTKWKVKMGEEARPETVASRFVWAVGYRANEDYFLPRIEVDQLPPKLKRGEKYREGSVIHDVRLKRADKEEKKLDTWAWKDNPFLNTRELNGLRVLMALINNWDLKDENNAILADHSYAVSDLGASFGSNGFSGSHEHDKGNLHSYENSRFIIRAKDRKDKYVDFATPGRAGMGIVFNPVEYAQRKNLESVGHHIPRRDAHWIGQLLAQLSPAQIRDAFRAADYSPEQVEGFAQVVEKRIAELSKL